jgi:hypothetical protein
VPSENEAVRGSGSRRAFREEVRDLALTRAQEALRDPVLARSVRAKQTDDPLTRSRRHPRSFRLAITAKCWDCQGGEGDPGWRQRVTECAIEDCGLWALRPTWPGRGDRDGEQE